MRIYSVSEPKDIVIDYRTREIITDNWLGFGLSKVLNQFSEPKK
jgi:hypothetical protein